ncbi:hypothetical protein [Cohnella sp. GbtcB17]|uniref:hypothetical protein n=1 Tax=Cohnella sp. GbtcB17 TaxID=2824762 RepID=UPI001C2F2A4F|nr:hypothetical protein [Cohnella sp. GbtcB17]
MKNNRSKLKVGILTVLLSIVMPVLIQFIFRIIFADYYTHGGFLPGLGHYFVTALMIIVNLIAAPIIILSIYTKLEQENIAEALLKRITIVFVASVIVQIGLSIWIENPFSPSDTDLWLQRNPSSIQIDFR